MIQIHAACIALPAGQIFFIAQGGAGICDIQCIAVLDRLTQFPGAYGAFTELAQCNAVGIRHRNVVDGHIIQNG